MKLLISLTARDVEPQAPRQDYETYSSRTAARVILFDNNKVALIQVKEHEYYMLPGGGIDDEGIIEGLKREVNEETGCDLSIIDQVGSIVVFFDRWQSKQTDYCYIANKVGDTSLPSPTNFESSEGHSVVWAKDITSAIKMVEGAEPKNIDGKLVRARDLIFLQQAATGLLK